MTTLASALEIRDLWNYRRQRVEAAQHYDAWLEVFGAEEPKTPGTAKVGIFSPGMAVRESTRPLSPAESSFLSNFLLKVSPFWQHVVNDGGLVADAIDRMNVKPGAFHWPPPRVR